MSGIVVRIEDRPDGRVAHITVDNAAKLNTLTARLMGELIEACAVLEHDPHLRAVVLRGAGERAFVGGADIREMAVLDQDSAERFITLVHRSCAALRALPVPVIAVIRGWALGAGLELAAAADLRIAAREARFGMPEVRVGIPSVVEAALLPHLIGWGRTRWLLLTGETIDAARALEWGLVEEVARQEQLEEVLGLLLDAILAGGAHAVRIQKALIRKWEDVSPAEGIEAGIAAFRDAYATDEPARMMRRFLEAAARRT